MLLSYKVFHFNKKTLISNLYDMNIYKLMHPFCDEMTKIALFVHYRFLYYNKNPIVLPATRLKGSFSCFGCAKKLAKLSTCPVCFCFCPIFFLLLIVKRHLRYVLQGNGLLVLCSAFFCESRPTSWQTPAQIRIQKYCLSFLFIEWKPSRN